MADHADGLRVRLRRPLPWGQALLMAILGITKTEVAIILALAGLGSWLLIPPVLQQMANVSYQPRQTLAFVVELPATLADKTLFIDASSEVVLASETVGPLGGTESLHFDVFDESGAQVRALRATVLHSGERVEPFPGSTVGWLCGFNVPTADSSMLVTKPMVTFVDGTDPTAAGAFDDTETPRDGWTSNHRIEDETAGEAAELDARGVGCMRHFDNIPSNEAGNRWFSPSDYLITFVFSDGQSDTYADDQREYLYAQNTEVIVPNTWEQVSGFVRRDGTEIGGGYLADLLTAQGFATTTLPVRPPRPGSLPNLVYVDSLVERAIEQRITAGWTILSAALAVLIGGYAVRLASLRREKLELL